jgi:hypothetical protein
VTAVSEVTLDGANVTVAFESGLVIVPPVVGEITVGGGERPLAVFAVGSGGVAFVPVGVVVASCGADWVVELPTTTVTVPVPDPDVAAGVDALAVGSGVVVAALASWVVGVVAGVVADESVGVVVIGAAALVLGSEVVALADASVVVAGGGVTVASVG